MPRALIIDDDELFCRIASDILQGEGFEVFCAAGGEEGWQILQSVPADIVLLDLNLPDIHGYELLDRLAQKEQAGRVIVVTSSFSLDSALQALRKGAGDYLPKPFNRESLATSVERVWNKERLRAENSRLNRELLQSQAVLSEWNQRLEQTVGERTRALREADQARQAAYDELMESHERLKQMQAMLLAREKTAALGMLGAGVAHEINNPLGFVRANLDALHDYSRGMRRLVSVMMHASRQAAKADAGATRRLLEEAARVVDEYGMDRFTENLEQLFDETGEGLSRIAGIVEGLRAFTEDGNLDERPELVDLSVELERAAKLIDSVRRMSGQGGFDRRLRPVPGVWAPLRSLRQSLIALLGLQLPGSESGSAIALACGENDGLVWVELSYPGARLTPQDMARLFDPFYLPGGRCGTGGLSLGAARGLARSLGGDLRALARPESLCLRLDIPAAATPPSAAGTQAGGEKQ